ncbi:hypothetical protein PAAG_05667 [Paracoccidioides lutzii Pb01]|uniref:Uncharacterized protein n=1 Tax=Paracoccidioides lutzii (strain ATCC MYA-826 / Pb01) TaxID=502779 RepID=C1H4H4_PARBA|nr:hypothetical protein PAAG_05667 [Paracoccidioides lutzii Pb01]EEH34618.2 hypothetical protein PAAG_05667 [Paracoccidioides lutzii Pb01]
MATATMSSSLSRAFTKRTQKPLVVSAPMPYREGQLKLPAGTIKRNEISLPVQLLSTTNLLAYTAPDLEKPRHKLQYRDQHQQHQQQSQTTSTLKKTSASSANSSSSSFRSAEDSDVTTNSSAASASSSSFVHTSSNSPLIPPEMSSAEEHSPVVPEPNHLSGYFSKPARSSSTDVAHRHRSSMSSSISYATPKLPRRSLSHTKKLHQELARQRSISRSSSSTSSSTTGPPPTSLTHSHSHSLSRSHSRSNSHSSSARLSTERLRALPESTTLPPPPTSLSTQQHPFGKELEQVNEVAEEFGFGDRAPTTVATATANDAMFLEDERVLASKGLRRFAVEEYAVEVEEVYRAIFDEGFVGGGDVWI